MKTTDYENMTDDELSAAVADALGIEKHQHAERKEKAIYDKGRLVDDWELSARHKPYASDMNVCCEAIDKFCNADDSINIFEFDKNWSNSLLWNDPDSGWTVIIAYTEDDDIIFQHNQNPARACSIAMLRALDKP